MGFILKTNFVTNTCNIFFFLGVEGLIYHKHLNSNVFSIRFVPSKKQVFATYSVGYGVPLIVVIATLIESAAEGRNHYVREYLEKLVCWLDEEAIIWAFIIPASIMIFFNLGVVIMIVNVAYHSASHQR